MMMVGLFSETTLLTVLHCCCCVLMSVDSVDVVFSAKTLYGMLYVAIVALQSLCCQLLIGVDIC